MIYTAKNEDGSDLPSWLSFYSGLFSGTPTSGAQGSYRIKIIAEDNFGTSNFTIFTITVMNSNRTSIFMENQVAKIGEFFLFTIPKNTFMMAIFLF